MKRLIAFLMVLTILLSCIAGCAKDSEKNKEKEATSEAVKTETYEELYGLDEETTKTLMSSVVMKYDTLHAFVGGFLESVSLAPLQDQGITFIPGCFVTEGLGGSVSYSDPDQLWNMKLDSVSFTVCQESGAVEVDGEDFTLQNQLMMTEEDFMISAEDYCAITGVECYEKYNLVLVGKNTKQAMSNLTEQGNTVMLGMMNSQLTGQTVGSAPSSTEQTDLLEAIWDRHSVSEVINIDPELIPYTSPSGSLVAVSDSLYVEDLSFKKHPSSDDYFICSMTVYNTGYTYGVAESFTADDRLVDKQILEPWGGRYTSVADSIINFALIIDGTLKWIDEGDMSEVEYRSRAVSTATKIELQVPKDGYIFLTNNPSYSQSVAACNFILIFSQIFSALSSLPNEDGNAHLVLDDLMQEAALSTALKDPIAVAQLANSFHEYIQMEIGTSIMDFTDYVNACRNNYATALKNCEYDMTGLMTSASETAISTLSEMLDISIKKVGESIPGIEEGLLAMDIIIGLENILCVLSDCDGTLSTKPLLFEACDWRAAYAELLRTTKFAPSGMQDVRFGLCYIDKDSIPELIVMDGSSAMAKGYVFSYQDGEVRIRKGQTASAYYGYMTYYEFGDLKIGGGMSHGYTSVVYEPFLFVDSGEKHVFTNDYYAMAEDESKTTYTYNGHNVPRFYYEYKMREIENKYAQYELKNLEYTDCYLITEENIKLVFENE